MNNKKIIIAAIVVVQCAACVGSDSFFKKNVQGANLQGRRLYKLVRWTAVREALNRLAEDGCEPSSDNAWLGRDWVDLESNGQKAREARKKEY